MELLETLIDPLSGKKRIESACQTGSCPHIVCRTCKGLGHYSRDCAVNKLQSKAKIVEMWKSKVSTRTIGLQTDSI